MKRKLIGLRYGKVRYATTVGLKTKLKKAILGTVMRDQITPTHMCHVYFMLLLTAGIRLLT